MSRHYVHGSYGSGGNRKGGGRSRPNKKPCGCTHGNYIASERSTVHKEGTPVPYLRGWRKQYGRFTSLFATPYKDTKKHKSKEGRVWENWIVTLETDGQSRVLPCLFDPKTKKVIIQNGVNWVMNPKGGAGGYVGPFYYKK